MADKGLVTSRAVEVEHEPGMPRRLFAPTGLGEKVFRAWETADAILREAWA
jgi:DNA-binding PadR family transcriptional regulator